MIATSSVGGAVRAAFAALYSLSMRIPKRCGSVSRAAAAIAASLALSCSVGTRLGVDEPLPGWELTAGDVGLAGAGVDRGELPLYAGPSRPAAGTAIRLRRIETGLDLSAGGITIDRCWIRPVSIGRGNSIIVTYDNNQDPPAPAPSLVTLRDCEIDGSLLAAEDVCYSAGFAGAGAVQRCDIHDVGSGIAVWRVGASLPVLIEGNYVHGLRSWGDPRTTGSHNDGFTIRDYAGPSAIVRDNRVDCSAGNDTGSCFIQAYSGPIDKVAISRNLFEGRGYNISLERLNYDYGREIRIVDNRFRPEQYPSVGYCSRGSLDYGWGEWRENCLDDPAARGHRGAPVAAP